MTDLLRLLDTGDLLAYAERTSTELAYQLAYCAVRGWRLRVSALCVAEAVAAASPAGRRHLRTMLDLPQVEVIGCPPEHAQRLGKLVGADGRLGAAHTRLLAAGSRRLLLPDSPDDLESR